MSEFLEYTVSYNDLNKIISNLINRGVKIRKPQSELLDK